MIRQLRNVEDGIESFNTCVISTFQINHEVEIDQTCREMI